MDIYCLEINRANYIVPLWHEQVYFESEEFNIVISNKLQLPNNCSIDENNDLHILVKQDIQSCLKEKFITVNIGKKVFEIPCDKLYVKEKQIYKIYNKGVPKIDTNNILNVDKLADIIFHIFLY